MRNELEKLYELFRTVLFEVDNINRGKALPFEDLVKKLQAADRHLCKILADKKILRANKAKYIKEVSGIVNDMYKALDNKIFSGDNLDEITFFKNKGKLTRQLNKRAWDAEKALPFRSIFRDYAIHLQHKKLLICGLKEIDQEFLSLAGYNKADDLGSGRIARLFSITDIPETSYDQALDQFINNTGNIDPERKVIQKEVFDFFANGEAEDILEKVSKQVYFDHEVVKKYADSYQGYTNCINIAKQNFATAASGEELKYILNFSEHSLISHKQLSPVRNISNGWRLDQFRNNLISIARVNCPAQKSGSLLHAMQKNRLALTAGHQFVCMVPSYWELSKSAQPLREQIRPVIVGNNEYKFNKETKIFDGPPKDQKLNSLAKTQQFVHKKNLSLLLRQTFARGVMGPEVAFLDTVCLSVLGLVYASRFFAKCIGYATPPDQYNMAYYYYKREQLKRNKSLKKTLVASGKNAFYVSGKTQFAEKALNVKDAAIELAQIDIDTIYYTNLYEMKKTKYGVFTSDTSALALNDLHTSQLKITNYENQISFLKDAKFYNYSPERLMELDCRENPNDTVETLQAKILKHRNIISEAKLHLRQHQKLLARVNLQAKMNVMMRHANTVKESSKDLVQTKIAP